ncbi:MAG: alpha/beta fold hydrolase [candidate division WOR-3 bacterium]|nr:MAG: alpha/beta fold hydrolase [candidate division WOR-3 bacterium]
MSRTEFAFPVGYHEFNKNKGINFQLNRYHSMGNATLEDMERAGQRIRSHEEWKTEMLELAETAVSEGRLMNAAFYYRAAEFFLLRDDPEKELLYQRFIDSFYRATQQDEISKCEVPYGDTFLPAMRIQRVGTERRGTLVLHGGNDSFVEEFYPVARYFSDHGYEVVAFEGPGQGAALKKYGLTLSVEWEKPTKAVLDYFKLYDVTLLGISMGGWLCLRAAAFEPRIQRVIPWSVSFDVTQYANAVGQHLARLFMRRFRNFANTQMLRNMKRKPEYSWFVNNLMYMTNREVPIEAMDVLMQFNEENLHSDLVQQDVLILTGREDHLVPFKMHDMQVKALTNARSVTSRIFTREEQAQNHCQIGNIGLALDVMRKWIVQKS